MSEAEPSVVGRARSVAVRARRFAASILAVVAGADALHLAYRALEQKTHA
ncbi:MAG TPA: hypothetical protein VHF24_00695 [Acidimicrobiales bacterium]|nr:hypothetical protein [Acidimicrobiales bacterium]